MMPRQYWRQVLALVLAVLMASPAAAAQVRDKSPKERVLEIPAGAIVAVRLMDGAKLRGRLGAVTDTGFELQAVRGKSVETMNVSFDQLKSIKDTHRQSFGWSLGKGFLIAGIVIGAITLIAWIACAASHGCIGG